MLGASGVRFISYVVLHEEDYKEAKKWCPNVSISILRNSFQHKETINHKNIRNIFREAYNIPEDAVLLARFTRIIPQKRLDRDIHLVNFLHQIAKKRQNTLDIYLVIAGNPN